MATLRGIVRSRVSWLFAADDSRDHFPRSARLDGFMKSARHFSAPRQPRGGVSRRLAPSDCSSIAAARHRPPHPWASEAEPPSRPRRRHGLRAGAAVVALALCGCPIAPTSEPPARAKPFEGLKLQVLVVDDRALADAVRRLSEEWRAQTGGQIELLEQGADQPLVAENLRADVVLFPAWQLGLLAEEKLLVPLPSDLTEGEQLAWPDIFEQLRLREATWGDEPLAVPLGSARLLLYYRADLLRTLGREPPTSWGEYQELAALLADRSQLGEAAPPADQPWYGTIEPLAPGFAGLTLLARAAPYAKHREHYSALFNMETMEPLINGPPFVRALEELVVAAKLGPPADQRLTPGEIRTAFWKGQCGLALVWPTASPSDYEVRARDPQAEVGFAALPGSREVWEPLAKFWDSRDPGESGRVVPVAPWGRLGAVTRKARSELIAPGFQFLLALSTEPWCHQASAFSGQTTLFRQTQIAQARNWVEREVPPPAARAYGNLVRELLAEPETLDALRMPGRDQYLAALDQAVWQAIAGELTPQEALAAAATQWRAITEGYQTPGQRRHYQRSLGLGF